MGVIYPQPTPGSSLKTGLGVTRKCVGSLSFISWSGARGDGRTPRTLLSSLTLSPRLVLHLTTRPPPSPCLSGQQSVQVSSQALQPQPNAPKYSSNNSPRSADCWSHVWFKGNLGQISEGVKREAVNRSLHVTQHQPGTMMTVGQGFVKF